MDISLNLAVAWTITNLDGDSDHAVIAPVRAPRVLENPDGVTLLDDNVLAWLPVAFSAFSKVAFLSWDPVALCAWNAALPLVY